MLIPLFFITMALFCLWFDGNNKDTRIEKLEKRITEMEALMEALIVEKEVKS